MHRPFAVADLGALLIWFKLKHTNWYGLLYIYICHVLFKNLCTITYFALYSGWEVDNSALQELLRCQSSQNQYAKFFELCDKTFLYLTVVCSIIWILFYWIGSEIAFPSHTFIRCHVLLCRSVNSKSKRLAGAVKKP